MGTPRLITITMFTWIAVVATFAFPANAKGTVAVYYSSTLSAKERQNTIKNEVSKDGFDVVVFGKFKDFDEEIKSKKPDVILAPSTFQKYNSEYSPVMRFTKGGNKQFKYLLLSLDKSWNPKNLSNGKLGIVEEVDREHLKDVASDLFKTKFKMVKSVSKPEDLFPLLIFKSADFIAVSPDDYERLKEKFSAKVNVVGESNAVDLPVVYIKKGQSSEEVISVFKKIPQSIWASTGLYVLEAAGASNQ